MRGRLPNGEWAQKDFDPTAWGGPFIEGNAWQYHWSVMHDIQGLIDLMGGESNFTAEIGFGLFGSEYGESGYLRPDDS